MQVQSWRCLTVAVMLSLGATLTAQTASKPAAKPSAWKSYCHPAPNFCFKYPAGWTMLGEVLGGNGVVVAPPQRQERELWDAVTVALVIPSPNGTEESVTVGEALAQALAGVRSSGQSFETEQRQQRTVNGKPAEMVKVHYVEQPSGRAWTEELVFIEGPQSEIYSVVLKSATASMSRMEPLFTRIVDSWSLPNAAEESGTVVKATPAPARKSSTPKPASPPNP